MWEGIFPPQLLTVLKQKVKQASQPVGHQVQPVQAHPSQWVQRQGSEQRPVSSMSISIPSTTGRNGYHDGGPASHLTGRPMSASYQHPHQRSDGFQAAYAPLHVQQPHAQSSWQAHQVVQQGSSAYPQPQQQHQQPLVLPNLLSSLLSSGLLTVPPSVSIAQSGLLPAAPAVSYTHPPSRGATPEAVDPEDCRFVPSRLKVLSWPLIIVPAVILNVCCRCNGQARLFILAFSQLLHVLRYAAFPIMKAACSVLIEAQMKGLCSRFSFVLIAVKILHFVLAQQFTVRLKKRNKLRMIA